MGEGRTGQRTTRLDRQWDAAGFHIVGLQETRTPQGRSQSDHFHILSSGAEIQGRTPNLGCELWIHKTAPISTIGQQRITSTQQGSPFGATCRSATPYSSGQATAEHLLFYSAACTMPTDAHRPYP